MNRRRQVFDSHLAGFALGDTTIEDVKEKLGKPSRTLEEEKVVVLEYEGPPEASIARWKKVQFIFFDELLLNVSYVDPEPKLARSALHAVLGQPDETPEDEDDEEGLSDIFEVELDEDPMLSFAAHYDEDENVEALSLCAEISEDELEDDEDDEDDDDGDEEDDSGDDEDDEEDEDDDE
ncbi:hypothetical protein HY251_16375 [bacterium]|nr:hypothetical protein [bacterium]